MGKSKQKLSKINKFFVLVRIISDFITDILFPIKCLRCKKEGAFICKKCLKTIPKNSFQVCPVCEKAITLNGDLCVYCKKLGSSPLTRLFVVSDYKNKNLSKAIHLMKYSFVSEIATPLGELSVETMTKLGNFATPDIIIPVPLHNKRLRYRGFNQSELLAKTIATKLLPGINIKILANGLIRKEYTKPQMKIKDYKSRQKNIKNCFISNPLFEKEIAQKRILLVDDICTTGSTLNECAKELRKLNPKSISAIVLARQS